MLQLTCGAERWGFSEVVQHGVELGVRDEDVSSPVVDRLDQDFSAPQPAPTPLTSPGFEIHREEPTAVAELGVDTTLGHCNTRGPGRDGVRWMTGERGPGDQQQAGARLCRYLLLLPTPTAPREGETVATRRCAKGTESGSHRGRGYYRGGQPGL